MVVKNIIVLIGNGFDIANGSKTSFSNFADYYIDEKIIPTLQDIILKKEIENPILTNDFSERLARKGTLILSYQNFEDSICYYVSCKEKEKLSEYLKSNLDQFKYILNNDFLGQLYSDINSRNWFDIEKIYFENLVNLKNIAKKKPQGFNLEEVKKLNKEFYEIRKEVIDYLQTVDLGINDQILTFLKSLFENVEKGYIINFNYTSSVKSYLKKINSSNNIIINHIHGDLESDNIIFGYGNDENNDYQEIKELEENEFLRYFKTFDYLNNTNYDRLYEEALDKYTSYEVLVLGHSLGLTDKTLLSEIFNSEKCKKISFFKRTDIKENPSLVRSYYRELTYSASRILTNEKVLRKKVVSFSKSLSFP